MSLVDYAASSDEDEPVYHVDEGKDAEESKQSTSKRPRFGVSAPSERTPEDNPSKSGQRISLNSTTSQKAAIPPDPLPDLKLPDASLLLNSPMLPSNPLRASNHSSWVAAAMAESESRKRDHNESVAQNPHRKISKGLLPHLKTSPDTVGGRLLPPQLTGRSNIVTEDISKLFVRKHAESSTET